MLAITQHNQQMVVKNANLEQLTEEENVGQTSRDHLVQASAEEPRPLTNQSEKYSEVDDEPKIDESLHK